MDKCDLIKLKNFCTTKEMVSKLRKCLQLYIKQGNYNQNIQGTCKTKPSKSMNQ
jgi:hypothetical protein